MLFIYLFTIIIPLWSKIVVTPTNHPTMITLNNLEYESMVRDTDCYRAASERGFISNFAHVSPGKYVLDGYEYNPTIIFREPGTVVSYDGDTACRDGVVRTFEEMVVMVNRFDVFNIYEMFHSLLNTHVLVTMFGLQSNAFTILFVDDSPQTPLNDDMFGVFTDKHVYGDRHSCYRFNGGVFKSPAEYTSILVTKHGPLKGRGVDHHCRSTLLRSFVNRVKTHFGVSFDDNHYVVKDNPTIVWSSRGVHTRGDNRQYTPTRMLLDEDELLASLQQHGYDIRKVDFGRLSAAESVAVVSAADVMIGVHGAGLMWSAFLPRHGGLVEIFGGDRGQNNRHYHNVASLSDLHYRDVKPGLLLTVVNNNLRWNGNIKLLHRIIHSITEVYKPWQEPGI